MRPLPLAKFAPLAPRFLRARTTRKAFFALAVLVVGINVCGCAQGTAGGSPPPPAIRVTVSPTTALVTLGNSQSFSAVVTNTTDTSVSWSVNGIPGGTASTGTITSAGVYTAPPDLPSPSTVQVTATSVADATKSDTANTTINSDIVLHISPNVSGVELGATQAFAATVDSSGHPDVTVRWSISGPSCPNECGSVDTRGNYSAPQILPQPAGVTLTAQSLADPSKQASAAVTVTSNFSLTLSAPANLPTNGTAAIVAILTPVPGSSPNTSLTWMLTGPGCSGSACGTLSAVTTQASSSGKTTNSATYSAPATAPAPNSVTISVTPEADPSKEVQAAITIAAGLGVSITPATATLAANHRITLTPQVSGSANNNVAWSVNNVAGGNTTLGQICVQGSNPCQPVLSAKSSPVDYLAPGSIASPNPVAVEAVSSADASKSAIAQITVINHVLVSVFPGNVTLAPSTVQGFTASVLGSGNQSVLWQISGTACTPGTEACGAIDSNGTYTAPPAAPSPNTLHVVAVSQDDPSQSGSATVIISTGANIVALRPASVYAGAAQGFTLQVNGSGFVQGASGTGSQVWIAGSARTTTCISASQCSAPVTPADVAIAGAVPILVKNPDGTATNTANLLVAPPNASDAIVALTSATPLATDQDIVVVDLTTAGVSTPDDDVDLNLAALGIFSLATNACTLAGNPVSLQRPPSGSATADICLFSQAGLDAGMTFTISGPGDISVIARQPVGLGILHITLLIPAAALPGPRTVFVQSTNLDKAAATGALQLQ